MPNQNEWQHCDDDTLRRELPRHERQLHMLGEDNCLDTPVGRGTQAIVGNIRAEMGRRARSN